MPDPEYAHMVTEAQQALENVSAGTLTAATLSDRPNSVHKHI